MKEYPWFKQYDPDVPRTLQPYPIFTPLDVFYDSLRQKPDYPMIIFRGREVSYKEVEEHSNALAAALVAWGVKKGDRVVSLFTNCPQSMIAFLGIWKAGAIAVPLNPLYTPFELQHSLDSVEPKVAIVGTDWYGMLKSLQLHTKLEWIVVSDLDTYINSSIKREGESLRLEKGDSWWSDVVTKYSGKGRPAVEVRPSDTAVILFSGGTTGTPKGVMQSHHSIVITGIQHKTWYQSVVTEWEDKIAVVLPLFHSYGLYICFGSHLMNHAPQVLIPNPRDVKSIVDTIRDYKTAGISVVPTSLIAILNHPDLKPDDLRSLKNVGCGAAPLMMETKSQFERLISGRVVEGYGLTESGIVGANNPVKGQHKLGSAGIPLPDVVLRTVDVDTGTRELKPGEEGEVIIKAPQVMQGYWKRPEETAEALRNGWLYTGDIGYLDEDGYLFLTARKKDLIKSAGFQVWPREIEEVLSMHPAIAEVCVAGIPDRHRVEAVKAWVVLKQGVQVTEEELRDFCRQRLTGYKVPHFFEFRTELPKTTVGKVLRRALQEEERTRLLKGDNRTT